MRSLKNIKILVVDDEPMLCELLVDLFVMEGATVRSARCGVEALDIMKETSIDVLISDVRMPGGDGPTLVKSLPAQQKTKMNIYFCSGFNDLSSDDLKSLGVLGQFQKPFDIDFIIDRIKKDLNVPQAVGS